MLFFNNPQAAKAILEGRRHDDGQRIASAANLARADKTVEPSPEGRTLLPRLSAPLTAN